jgi:hypothetical protein
MIINQEYLLSLIDQRVKDIIYEKYKESDPQDITACLVELMKYLYLTSKYPKTLAGTFVPIAQEVDDLWHQLILQTHYYPKICQRLPGKRFIHHESMPFGDYVGDQNDDATALIPEILCWVPYYVKTFGDIQPAAVKYWCFFYSIIEVQDLDIDTLNKMGREDTYFEIDPLGENPA